jgi:ABC-2 type transport system permease protein
MTTGNAAFQLVDERGWRRGLNNLLQAEFSSWFKSRKWWVHVLIWLFSINLILLFTIIGARDAAMAGEEAGDDTVQLYSIFGGMFVMIGVIVVAQGAIIGEKKSGTVAWILSKPVSRTAFVISKLVGNGVGLLFTAVLVPGLIAYFELYWALESWPPLLNFVAGVATLGLHMFFWLSLTIMLGAFFDSWGPIIGIPLAFAFGQNFIAGFAPFLLYVFPWALAVPAGDKYPSLAWSFVNGEAPFSWLPLIAAVVFSVLFVTLAIWRFGREEF